MAEQARSTHPRRRAPGLARILGLALLGALACGAAPGLHAQEEAGKSFQAWLQGVRAEAAAQGIAPATLDEALAGVAPIPRVVELDRRQPESTLTFAQYLERVVPARRVEIGRRKLAEHRELLAAVGARYGVQPRYIVALWGVETGFGRITGSFPVIAALATLAYDGRRAEFFRGELLKALRILDEGHIAPAQMKGSWAGAMGQVQFMPSSFLRYARDHDDDGRQDIWTSTADAFASAANYLAGVGWRDDQTWGREVRLPDDLDPDLIGTDVVKGLADWQALGVRRADGSDLPGRNLPASIIRPDGAGGPAYAVYDNFRALLRWNRSHYFATAVGILSDRIAGRSG